MTNGKWVWHTPEGGIANVEEIHSHGNGKVVEGDLGHFPLNRPRDTVSRRNSRLPGSHSLIATGIPVTVPRRSQWRELSVSASRVPSDRARRPWSTAFAAAPRAAAAWPL